MFRITYGQDREGRGVRKPCELTSKIGMFKCTVWKCFCMFCNCSLLTDAIRWWYRKENYRHGREMPTAIRDQALGGRVGGKGWALASPWTPGLERTP
jgi:hypothetical protein